MLQAQPAGDGVTAPVIDKYYIKGRGNTVGTSSPAGASGSGSGSGSSSNQCRVPGCTADLNKDLAYFRKYRICREHLKSPVLVVESVPSRFCQQCSRFHHVKEFDGSQRTCRAMLERLRIKRNSSKAVVGSGRTARSKDTRRVDSSQQQGSSSRSNSNDKEAERELHSGGGAPSRGLFSSLSGEGDAVDSAGGAPAGSIGISIGSFRKGGGGATAPAGFLSSAASAPLSPHDGGPALVHLSSLGGAGGSCGGGISANDGLGVGGGAGAPSAVIDPANLFLTQPQTSALLPLRGFATGPFASVGLGLSESCSGPAAFSLDSRMGDGRDDPSQSGSAYAHGPGGSPAHVYRGEGGGGRMAGVMGMGGGGGGGNAGASRLSNVYSLGGGSVGGYGGSVGGPNSQGANLSPHAGSHPGEAAGSPRMRPATRVAGDMDLELQLRAMYREMAIGDPSQLQGAGSGPLQSLSRRELQLQQLRQHNSPGPSPGPGPGPGSMQAQATAAAARNFSGGSTYRVMGQSVQRVGNAGGVGSSLQHRSSDAMAALNALHAGLKQEPMDEPCGARAGPVSLGSLQAGSPLEMGGSASGAVNLQSMQYFDMLQVLPGADGMDVDALGMGGGGNSHSGNGPSPPPQGQMRLVDLTSMAQAGGMDGSGGGMGGLHVLALPDSGGVGSMQAQGGLYRPFPDFMSGGSGGSGSGPHEGSRPHAASYTGMGRNSSNSLLDGRLPPGQSPNASHASLYGCSGMFAGGRPGATMEAIPEAGDGANVWVSAEEDIDAALDMLMEEGGTGAVYQNGHAAPTLERVCLKMHNVHPQDLPPDLLSAVGSWLASAPAEVVQGAIRPGCTHLILDVYILGPDRAAASTPAPSPPPPHALEGPGASEPYGSEPYGSEPYGAAAADPGSGGAGGSALAPRIRVADGATVALRIGAAASVRDAQGTGRPGSTSAGCRVLQDMAISDSLMAELNAAAAAAGAEALDSHGMAAAAAAAAGQAGGAGGETMEAVLRKFVMHHGNTRAAATTFRRLLGMRAAQALTVTVGHEVLTMATGQPTLHVADVRGTMAGVKSPLLVTLLPLAVATGQGPCRVRAVGSHLIGAGRRPHVRSQGSHVPCQVVSTSPLISQLRGIAATDLATRLAEATLPGSHRSAAVSDCMEVEISLTPTDPGLLMVEWGEDRPGAAATVSEWHPLLAVPDASMAMEINRLAAAKESTRKGVRSFLVDLGLVLDFTTRLAQQVLLPVPAVLPPCEAGAGLEEGEDVERGTDTRAVDAAPGRVLDGVDAAGDQDVDTEAAPDAGGPASGSPTGEVYMDSRAELLARPRIYKKHLSRVALLTPQLLAFAADAGLSTVIAYLLDFMLEYIYFGDLAAIFAAVEALGLPLLHRAVRSGSARSVQLLMARAANSGLMCNFAQPAGPYHVTPLHLAALQPANPALLQACKFAGPGVEQLWHSVRDAAGRTPAMIAGRTVERAAIREANPANRVANRLDVFRLSGSGGSTTTYRSWGSDGPVSEGGPNSAAAGAGVTPRDLSNEAPTVGLPSIDEGASQTHLRVIERFELQQAQMRAASAPINGVVVKDGVEKDTTPSAETVRSLGADLALQSEVARGRAISSVSNESYMSEETEMTQFTQRLGPQGQMLNDAPDSVEDYKERCAARRINARLAEAVAAVAVVVDAAAEAREAAVEAAEAEMEAARAAAAAAVAGRQGAASSSGAGPVKAAAGSEEKQAGKAAGRDVAGKAAGELPKRVSDAGGKLSRLLQKFTSFKH